MPDQPVDPSRPEPNSPEMEGRVSRPEATAEATRADIADIRGELRGIRAEMRTELSGMRIEIAGVRTEIAGVRSESATMFRWIIGLMLAMMGGFAALYTQLATILARLPK